MPKADSARCASTPCRWSQGDEPVSWTAEGPTRRSLHETAAAAAAARMRLGRRLMAAALRAAAAAAAAAVRHHTTGPPASAAWPARTLGRSPVAGTRSAAPRRRAMRGWARWRARWSAATPPTARAPPPAAPGCRSCSWMVSRAQARAPCARRAARAALQAVASPASTRCCTHARPRATATSRRSTARASITAGTAWRSTMCKACTPPTAATLPRAASWTPRTLRCCSCSTLCCRAARSGRSSWCRRTTPSRASTNRSSRARCASASSASTASSPTRKSTRRSSTC
mmetsp:Transcript_41391/g.123590  ORF Transcript_41391/g.123590 Transcript_41391/m.123590 type:complete len:286 (+) Transcript_41391:1687-2544(+)